MIDVGFSKAFKRALKRKVKGSAELEDKFWKKLAIFIEDPFDTSLRTHKLTGKLKNLWSFSVDYDFRVIFYFAKENRVVLVDIGKHDEVY